MYNETRATLPVMLGLLSILLLSPPANAEGAEKEFSDSVREMERVLEHVDDATYKMHLQEYSGGRLQPAAEMVVKYRKSGDTYMAWVGERFNGREAIYRGRNWNGGKMVVKPGPWIPTISLHPNGMLAMRGQRHPIYDSRLPVLIRFFVSDVNRTQSNPDKYNVSVTDEGHSIEYGEQAHCYSVELPKDEHPEYYSEMLRMCVNDRTKMPSVIQAWSTEDGELRMVEDYGFKDIQLNPGLSEDDFDPENGGYGF